VCIRIQLSRATVKDLQSRLQQAYQKDDVRLVRRTTVLIDLLVHHVPVAVLGERWGLSPACIYAWQKAFILHGMDSLIYRHGGGRQPKLTTRQQKRLVELMEAGPHVVGCETACWTSVLIPVLIWREFGVLDNRHDVCMLRHNVGCSFQKARCGSDHLDEARRQAWRNDTWPTILRAAKRRTGLLLFEEVPTSGKRKGSKVLGAIADFSGRLFSQGREGRLTSENSQAFVQTIIRQTTARLFLMHAGRRYHPRKATQQCVHVHRARSTVHPLLSYAPDDHPIASLWRKTKKRATHKKDFEECAALTVSVDKALAYFATHPETFLDLFILYCEESSLALKQAA